MENNKLTELVIKIEFPLTAEAVKRLEEKMKKAVLDELAALNVASGRRLSVERWPGGTTTGLYIRDEF
jgi:hypothetical protein